MNRDEFLYTENYCEENIFHLLAHPAVQAVRKWVVFISNQSGRVAMLAQRSRPDGVVIWDYHVVLITANPRPCVWDLDTTLALPCNAAVYLNSTFSSDVPEQYLPRFRVLAADTFRREFCSDRRHMRDRDGRYISSPPQWPAIRAESGSNLSRFIDMDSEFYGVVLTMTELRNHFPDPDNGQI